MIHFHTEETFEILTCDKYFSNILIADFKTNYP